MLEGKVPVTEVGVEGGSTLTDVCGERDMAREWVERLGLATELLEVVEARERLWWWVWMLRTEDTDEEVDFRPRSPELRR